MACISKRYLRTPYIRLLYIPYVLYSAINKHSTERSCRLREAGLLYVLRSPFFWIPILTHNRRNLCIVLVCDICVFEMNYHFCHFKVTGYTRESFTSGFLPNDSLICLCGISAVEPRWRVWSAWTKARCPAPARSWPASRPPGRCRFSPPPLYATET